MGRHLRAALDEEVDIIGFTREWLEARKLEGRMTGRGRWMPDIEHRATRMSCRRVGGLFCKQQDMVAPLTASADALSCARMRKSGSRPRCSANCVRCAQPNAVRPTRRLRTSAASQMRTCRDLWMRPPIVSGRSRHLLT